MTRRITWITGARGFIGRHVARSCALHGDAVSGLGYGSWSAINANQWGLSHWLEGKVTAENLSKLKENAGFPTRIIHLAGGSSVAAAIDDPKNDFFRTVSSTAELLNWVRIFSPETSIVVASSAAVYGNEHSGPILENATLKPMSPYGYHKLIMESLCRSYCETYGIRIVIARLFSVYGEGLTKQLLWDVCNKLKATPKTLVMAGTGQETRDWVSIEDVAMALPALDKYSSNSCPAINLATGIGTSVSEIVNILINTWQMHHGGDLIKVYFDGKSRYGNPISLIANTQLLSNMDLLCTRSAKNGVESYCTWFYRQDFNST